MFLLLLAGGVSLHSNMKHVAADISDHSDISMSSIIEVQAG